MKNPYSIEDVELDPISLGGFFSPSSNAICINTICEDTRKIYVMLHELGHAFYHNLEAQKVRKKMDKIQISSLQRREKKLKRIYLLQCH